MKVQDPTVSELVNIIGSFQEFMGTNFGTTDKFLKKQELADRLVEIDLSPIRDGVNVTIKQKDKL